MRKESDGLVEFILQETRILERYLRSYKSLFPKNNDIVLSTEYAMQHQVEFREDIIKAETEIILKHPDFETVYAILQRHERSYLLLINTLPENPQLDEYKL